MAGWTFLTYHARVLLLVARDPGVRLRDIAASLDITERSAFAIITDLAGAGYVVKEKKTAGFNTEGESLTASHARPGSPHWPPSG